MDYVTGLSLVMVILIEGKEAVCSNPKLTSIIHHYQRLQFILFFLNKTIFILFLFYLRGFEQC